MTPEQVAVALGGKVVWQGPSAELEERRQKGLVAWREGRAVRAWYKLERPRPQPSRRKGGRR